MDDARPIMLFDGVCNFCNGAVNFIIQHDRSGQFRFASLQSEVGQKLLRTHGLADLPLSTSVLIDGDRVYLDSTGILRTALKLGGAFKLVAPLLIVPRPLRDWAYRVFARNRYSLFGRADQCMVPTPELRERFLDMV